MADYGFNTQLTPNIPQTSLADMMNLARGAQAYQQAQQLNPLQLQALQQQVEQARQMNPLQIQQLQQSVQQAKEMNPLQLRQQGAAATLAEKTLNPKIEEATAQASSATTKSQADKLDYAMKHTSNAVQQLQTIVNKRDLNEKDIVDFITENVKSLGGPPEAITQALVGLPKNGTPTELRAFAAKKQASMLSTQAQLEKIYSGSTMTNEGATITPRQMGNPLLTGVAAGTPMGPSVKTTLPPTVVTSETGAPRIFGGGGNTPAPTVQPIAQPNMPAMSNIPQPKPNAGVATNLNQAFENKGGLQLAPGETYDTYKARVSRLGQLPDFAAKSMSLANPESVPNTQKINNNILTLLDDKDVNVGKVADFIAGKTGGITLSPKEQVIQKYLEQRTRQISTRSNQDAASVKQALGSFGNDKDALRTIIYNDAGTLSAEKMYNQGVLRARGNPNQPNLAAVADFEQKFSQLATDPDVMHLIGVVGEKSLNQLSESDKKHFQQYFKGKNVKQLFDKKDAIENLVRGGQ